MDTVSDAVSRAIATYTQMGTRGDQQRRQLLIETVRKHVQCMFEQGQHDKDKLVVGALKYLVSLEGRPRG